MPSRIALLLALVLPALQPEPLDTVLARAGTFAATIHRDAGRLIADESLLQIYGGTASSQPMIESVEAEVAMVARPGGAGWDLLRDVARREGEPVARHTDGRLARLLARADAESASEARSISALSGHFLLRAATQVVTAPQVPLVVLLPSEQPRFKFTDRGTKERSGVTARVVSFEEVRGPGLFLNAKGELIPMTGELWIEPRSGAVVRSVLRIEGTGLASETDPVLVYGPARVSVEVLYKPDPTLKLPVPVEMRASVSRDVGLAPQSGISAGDSGASHYRREELVCISTIRNHRQLPAPRITTDEER